MPLGRLTSPLALSLLLFCGKASAQAPAEWTPAEEEARAPHHARSFVEMGAGLVLGTSGYFLLLNQNIVDWDNPALKRRFDGSAWIVDNNNLAVNFLGHPATGGLSYSFARANHQSVLGSFGYSFATSFLWELAIEFKEKVSVNDVIATPGAGLPIGEFFYKLGLYLDTGHQDSSAVGALRWLLGTGVMVDRHLDGRAAPPVRGFDNLGFSCEIWHEFEARYGGLWISSPGVVDYARFDAGLRMRLVTLLGYQRPGAFGRGFYAAEISDFSLGVEASRHGAGVLFESDTIVAGYHAQRFERSAAELRGESLTVGTSVGFDYLYSAANRYGSVERAMALPEPNVKYHVPRRRDQYGAFQLPGLAAELSLQKNWGKLRLSGRVQPSFAGLSATAFYDWTAAHPDERSKHVLHHQGYFYGWGGAGHLRSGLDLGALRASAEVTYAAYTSQNGLDRHFEQVTNDTTVTGSLLRYALSLGVAPRDDVSVSLDYGVRRFRSRVEQFDVTARVEERGVSARWSF